MLKWLLVSTIFSLSLLIASTASANEVVVPLKYKGQAGFWFPGEKARLVLQDVEELRVLRESHGLLERQLQLRSERMGIKDAQLGATTAALDLSMQAEERTMEVVENSERRARVAEEKLDSFWRQPETWLVIGGVLVISIEIVVILSYKALEK